MSNQENINKALEEYRKGNITLDDYLKVCEDNFENKSENVETEPKFSHEISRNSVLNFGDMKLIGDSTENEIYPLIESYLREALTLADIDTDIIGIQIISSRTKGTNKETSDLDVLVEYNNGSLGEDDLFNFLNDEENPLEIDGIRVDFNPITESRSGTIEEWLDRNYDYDKYKEYEDEEEI